MCQLHFTLDIDECSEGLAECNQRCQNTADSYYCTCFGPGYRLQDDNSTCLSKKFTVTCLNLSLVHTMSYRH